jgi:2'-5' RNA ligase
MKRFKEYFTEATYDYYSTQIKIEDDFRSKILEFGKSIDKDDLVKEDGKDLETDPHVTVLFGINKDEPDKVQELVKDFKPFEISFGKTSIFDLKSGNCALKIEVEGKRLHDLHNLIRDNIKCTETHKTYKPHATIAYIKKGSESKYIDKKILSGDCKVSQFQFSSKGGKKETIKI